jgi:prepilin-type N-terminal cleavage/methylation domain-containing protein/prepilin-type processing-associated H-X9-DG protein
MVVALRCEALAAFQDVGTADGPRLWSVGDRRRGCHGSVHEDRRPSGFSLVELLVVTAILTVLVSLMLTGVQSAREASRRTTCANQLKQFGTALQNYEGGKGSLPAGHGSLNPSTPVPPSLWNLRTPDTWFAAILPYLEKQPIYDQFRFDEGTGSTTNAPLVALPLDGVACPSDTIDSPVCRFRCNLFAGPTAATMLGLWYAGSVGNNPIWGKCAFCAPTFPDSTNASCCSGSDRGVDGKPSGMFSVSRQTVRLASVQDGTTKTILLGETLPQESMHNGAYTGHFPIVATNIPVNSFVPKSDWPSASRPVNNWDEASGIKSRHPGGAYVAMVGGSVTFVAETIDFEVFRRLGSRAGYEISQQPE